MNADGLHVHFLVARGLRGQARILRAVFFQQRFEMADDVFRQVLEILARLFEFRLDLVHLLAMLVDVEQRNPADANVQQFFHVGVHEVANELLLNGLKPS